MIRNQGVQWNPPRTQGQGQRAYSETHRKYSEIAGLNRERIPLRGEESRRTLFTEGDSPNWIFNSHEISRPLACGCVPFPGQRIKVLRNGQAVCEKCYRICALCGREALPQTYTMITIDQPKPFHRHPCAEYVLGQILRNEKANPTLPQSTLAYLENLFKDIRAERSFLWSLIYWRWSRASIRPQ